MAYDRESYYLTWGGTLFLAEQWQCGLKFGPGLGTSITEPVFNLIGLTDIWDDLVTWFQSGNSGAQIGSAAKLTWVKLAVLKTDGQYKFEPRLYEGPAPVAPPVTTTYPAQVAYCVSLWSGQTLGRANHGRFYVPVPSAIVGQASDGLLTAAQANQMRDAAKTMITAVAGEIDTIDIPTMPMIMSKLSSAPDPNAPGVSKVIEEIGVGRVLDTQRRRRNHLNESMNYIGSGFLRGARSGPAA